MEKRFEKELIDYYENAIDIINDKFEETLNKYGEARFIKFPETIYYLLFNYKGFLKSVYKDDLLIDFYSNEIYNMEICYTSTIKYLKEIEVF